MNTVKGFPNAVSQAVIASAFGKTSQAIGSWKGCPRNPDRTYSLPAVIEWRLKLAGAAVEAEKETMDQLRKRKLKAVTEKAEFEMQLKRGELLPTQGVKDAWFEALDGFKTGLLGIPNAVAPELTGKETAEAARILDVAIRKALYSLRRCPGVTP